MTALDYRNRLAPAHRTKLLLPRANPDARDMDVDRLKKACSDVRPSLGIAPGLTGSFSVKFEAGRCTFAEMKRHLAPQNNEAVAELKAALGLPPDFYGAIEVRMEDGVPVLARPETSVRMK